MKTIIATILSLAIGTTSTIGMIEFQQRLQTAEKRIQTLEVTVEAYHAYDQSKPYDDETEMMIRLRMAIKNCGCTFK